MDERHERPEMGDTDTLPAGPGEADTLPAGPGGDAGPRSLTRRAALAAAVGGAAALAAQAAGLAHPAVVDAADGTPLRAGRTTTATRSTGVTTSTGNTAIVGTSATGDGLAGVTNGPTKSGVYGVSGVNGGFGVFGRNLHSGATGALGTRIDGVQGRTVIRDSAGVRGECTERQASGVVGINHGNGTVAALGHPSGAVYASVDHVAASAPALYVDGPVFFSHSGLIRVPAGSRSGWTGMPGVTDGTFVLATVQGDGSIAVAAAQVDVAAARINVFLTSPAPMEVTVAWWAFELPA